MSESIDINNLQSVGIGNTDHVTRRLIKGGKKEMVARELVDNAAAKLRVLIENTFCKDNTIYIRGLRLTPGLMKGVDTSNYKFCVMQEGGMTNIREMESIGSSADKTLSDDGNFGMGSRTSTLSWSDLCYITRKNGVAQMLILGVRQKKVKVLTPVGDVTQWVEDNAKERNYPDGDFTEVMLLGREGDMTQNTVQNPWVGKQASGKNSVAGNFWTASLHRRFVEMPHKIVFQRAKTDAGNTYAAGKDSATFGRNFITWHEAFMKANTKTRPNKDWIYDVVIAKEDPAIKLHYYFDPKMTNSKGKEIPISTGSTQSMSSAAFSGLIWKSTNGYREYFDVQVGSAKTVTDQMAGIVGGQDHFRMFVELPTVGYEPNDTRTGLRTEEDLEDRDFRYYIGMLVSNMKDDYKEQIKKYSTATKGKNLDDRLRKLLEKLRKLTKLSTVNVSATPKPGPTPGPKPGPNPKPNPNPNPNPKPRPPYVPKSVLQIHPGNKKNKLPEIELIDIKEVSSVELEDFIARYVPSVNDDLPNLLFNVQHPLIDRIIEELQCSDLVSTTIRPYVMDEIKLKLAAHCCLNKSLVEDDDYQFTHTDFKNMTTDPALLSSALHYQDFLPDLQSIAKKMASREAAGTLVSEDGVVNEDVITDGSDARDTALEEKFVAAGGELPKKTGTDNK